MDPRPVPDRDEAPTADVLALFALCPLLAVSDTVGNALSASIAMLVVMIVSTLIAATLPRWLQRELRFAALAIIVTSVVAALSLFARAWFPHVHESLGVFLILIASNVLLLAQARTTQLGPLQSLVRASRTGAFVLITMLALGIAREIVGRGSVLRESSRLFGAWSASLYEQLFREDMGFLLAVLPPGAFISLGLLFAAAKWWLERRP